MKKVYLYFGMFVFALLLFICPLNRMTVLAEDFSASSQTEEDKPLLRADIIETKFRVYYGKLQYRNWNRTRGKWVEDHWITLS